MLIYSEPHVQIHHADGLGWCGTADALITDTPYSPKTHAGATDFGPCMDGAARRRLDDSYSAWTADDVRFAVASWAPSVRGWFVSITDHVLAPVWMESLDAQGRYVFAPLPAVIKGGGVRLSGDGPSSVTRWVVVSRPRSREFSRWGTLPGYYEGPREQMAVIGGKPLWLMRGLVSDYSRVGDTVVDPCCGGGTTLVAAKELGRASVGYEIDELRALLAAERVRETRQLSLPVEARQPEQLTIGGDNVPIH